MRKRNRSLAGILIDPFLDYLSPQTEALPSSEREGSVARDSVLDSEKFCLLIFVSALVIVAVISPILCIGSLFIKLSLEGMWYFWLITFADVGCLVWRLARRIGKRRTNFVKPLDNRTNCNILKLYEISDTTKNLTEFGGLYYAKES